jgi:polar amino acid transport system substrate-binding protein
MRIRQILFCFFCLILSSGARAETVTIGAEDSWFPYYDVVKGKPAGFTVDLVQAAFGAVRIDVKFQSMPYARCMKLVKDGRLLGCFNPARASMVEADHLKHDFFSGQQPATDDFSGFRMLLAGRGDYVLA